jgi:hypothetical protein
MAFRRAALNLCANCNRKAKRGKVAMTSGTALHRSSSDWSVRHHLGITGGQLAMRAVLQRCLECVLAMSLSRDGGRRL